MFGLKDNCNIYIYIILDGETCLDRRCIECLTIKSNVEKCLKCHQFVCNNTTQTDHQVSESGMKFENEVPQCSDKHHEEECEYILQLKFSTCEYMTNKKYQESDEQSLEQSLEHNCSER